MNTEQILAALDKRFAAPCGPVRIILGHPEPHISDHCHIYRPGRPASLPDPCTDPRGHEWRYKNKSRAKCSRCPASILASMLDVPLDSLRVHTSLISRPLPKYPERFGPCLKCPDGIHLWRGNGLRSGRKYLDCRCGVTGEAA